MSKPIAITMGDPAGVGPELICKLISARPQENIIIFGDATLFEELPQAVRLSEVSAFEEGIGIFHVPCEETPIAGNTSLRNAQSIITSIKQATQAVKSGAASALLTAPINKANLVEGAAFQFPGHTEFLAHLDQAEQSPVMMLAAEGVLRVVPATIHIPLEKVACTLNSSRLRSCIETVNSDLAQYLGKPPRIAVSGLNPHAGESGHIGSEELEWISPLIDEMAQSGYDIYGPLSADTMFHEKAREQYDVAICMYHDQALIPIKTLAFDKGVNVTLGLSFLRTSPDHGTAYDIAGKGIADPSSMIAAFDLARAWSQNG